MTRSSGKVWASQQYISGEIGLSTRTVAPAVRALEDAGLIVTEKRAGRADVIWVQLTPVLIFPDGPEDDAEFEG
jgi:DNA-binding MarR family transcriptional regulator